ncbi:MAG: PA14 domain-containing protein [Desulfobacterales bacterium]|nr:PA14 domain-containing protein [Desulfobacterales bacterium]
MELMAMMNPAHFKALKARHVAGILLAAWVVMTGCSPAVTGSKLTRPTADAGAIRPGLAVLYFDDFYKSIYTMPSGKTAVRDGKPGPPIPFLNHRFGTGPVFGSGKMQGVGLQLTGFINFAVPGKYLFKAQSNDGIQIFIQDKMVINDPYVHSDRFSAIATVEVDRSGWYPFKALYFQRKGTAMIELYWQAPGETEFRIVPAAAFGHVPAAPY